MTLKMAINLVSGAWAFYFFGVITPLFAICLTASMIILLGIGIIKIVPEAEEIVVTKEDDKELEHLNAKIKVTDAAGNEAVITIKPSGDVDIDGTVDPEIAKSLREMRESIRTFGPAAVADEIQRQIKEINEADKGDKDV